MSASKPALHLTATALLCLLFVPSADASILLPHHDWIIGIGPCVFGVVGYGGKTLICFGWQSVWLPVGAEMTAAGLILAPLVVGALSLWGAIHRGH
jgi:hypothetical protein